MTDAEAREAEPDGEGASGEISDAEVKRRVSRIALASLALLAWLFYALKTRDPHPRMLGAVVCGMYSLVAFTGLRKTDALFFPIAALAVGLSFWLEGVPGVIAGILGALLGSFGC